MIAALWVHWDAQAAADMQMLWLQAAPLRQACIIARLFDRATDADAAGGASTRALTGTPPSAAGHSANAMASTNTPNA